ncbi:hypothetical protein C8Q73DRAFT_189597 [Cubamyces lactineus]|nr:hypothetical protein C8Q73DRAFT_189597 [Cubamyces lactineus]
MTRRPLSLRPRRRRGHHAPRSTPTIVSLHDHTDLGPSYCQSPQHERRCGVFWIPCSALLVHGTSSVHGEAATRGSIQTRVAPRARLTQSAYQNLYVSLARKMRGRPLTSHRNCLAAAEPSCSDATRRRYCLPLSSQAQSDPRSSRRIPKNLAARARRRRWPCASYLHRASRGRQVRTYPRWTTRTRVCGGLVQCPGERCGWRLHALSWFSRGSQA